MLALISIAFVFAFSEEKEPPEMKSYGSLGMTLSNSILPESIPAKDGELTVYAEFDKAQRGRVPIYLVNRTTQIQVLSSQDYDLYLKLERRLPDGNWERVQTHKYSWCGNSYLRVELPPDCHFVFSGYMPANGTKAQVRYRSYGNDYLISNEGEGFYLEEERIAAGLDNMSLRDLPDAISEVLQFNPDLPKQFHGNVTNTRYLSALRLVSSYRESPYARKSAEVYMGLLNDSDSETPKVAEDIRNILSRKWPEAANLDSLIQTAFVEMEEHPTIAWSVLTELVMKRMVGEKSEYSQKMVQEMNKALLRDSEDEITEIAKLIAIPAFADEHFADDTLMKWIRLKHEKLVSECASTLSRRQKFDELSRIGAELEPNSQVIVLMALSSTGSSESVVGKPRNPQSEIERQFWIDCAKKQPSETVTYLYHTGLSGENNLFDLTLYEPLKDFLHREANTPNDKIDGWEIGKVVAFVGAWKRKEDIPLFRSLLNHPACHISVGSKSSMLGVQLEFRRYRVREEARRALIAMGESVPENLILEEERVIHKPNR